MAVLAWRGWASSPTSAQTAGPLFPLLSLRVFVLICRRAVRVLGTNPPSVSRAPSIFSRAGVCLRLVWGLLALRLTARVKGVSIFLTICAIVMFLVSFLPIWGFCGHRRFADFCFSSVLGHEEPVVKQPFPVGVETASIVGHAPRPRGSARLAGGRDEPCGSVAPRRSGRESWLSAFFTPAADVFLSSLPFRMIRVANPLWALTQIGLNYRVCLRNSTPG